MTFHEDCMYFEPGDRPRCVARMDLKEGPVEIDGKERSCEGCRVYEIQRLVDCDHIGNFAVFRVSEKMADVRSDAEINCTRDGGATAVKISSCINCEYNRLRPLP